MVQHTLFSRCLGVILCSVFFLTACSSSPALPTAKTRTSLTNDVDEYQYLIGPGDTLNIFVWRLARQIEEVLAKYIRNPSVTVSVGTFNGPLREQVRVIGEASEPRSVAYVQHMTLLDLMIAVGGLTEFADGNSAKLIRVIEGERRSFPISLDKLIRDGDISANIDMLPGDIVIIPEAWF